MNLAPPPSPSVRGVSGCGARCLGAPAPAKAPAAAAAPAGTQRGRPGCAAARGRGSAAGLPLLHFPPPPHRLQLPLLERGRHSGGAPRPLLRVSLPVRLPRARALPVAAGGRRPSSPPPLAPMHICTRAPTPPFFLTYPILPARRSLPPFHSSKSCSPGKLPCKNENTTVYTHDIICFIT